MLLHLVAYVATILGFCFLVLSLACGLYYLAELVEEYTVYTKKVIKAMTIVVVSIHVLLWVVDGLPFFRLAFSIMCHGVYTLNLKTFPFINLLSPAFIASCLLVFVDHFVWFRYFSVHYRAFMDIAAFFGVCVWLIPFTYFISLSANDNALPLSSNQEPSTVDAIPSQHKKGLFRSVFSIFERKSDMEFPAASASSSSSPPSMPSGIQSMPYGQDTMSYSHSPQPTPHHPSLQHRKAA
ncbi:transmembrane adaptor Erv26-domain-containing protein [Syncephalastrum racemosum]|uniref:Transmembrane adaptor Erv26-domain-containing protein n=1 Tax=Syncephalastrum racemosum TaxID=13706 RepID=A0A1X2HV74_SYNRA|nr:transmembrane adaptor Erv26-domain-containing protein [Syncephalastrum racemosum]